MADTVQSIRTADEFNGFLEKSAVKSLIVVHFSAAWAPQCKQVNDVLSDLSADPALSANVIFVQIEAETFPEISSKYNIVAVPTCLLFKCQVEVDRVNGVNVAELTKKVQQHCSTDGRPIKQTLPPSSSVKPPEAETQSLNDRLRSVINEAPVMIFIKGTPDQPKCGFSKTLIQILADQHVQYKSFDILMDEQVRQGLKEYSNWPTYPQIYINGELVGGLDIVKELIANGEFQTMLPKNSESVLVESLDDRLRKLISRENVMLFMKGSPSTPKCGFSKTITEILSATGVSYGHFDILEDNEVREGLKTFSNWPTFPQLYVNGELIGGLDIVRELRESGELDSVLRNEQK